MPMIDNPDADRLRLIFSSTVNIQAHAAALAKIVHDHGYVGMDLDYEHLWQASDRAGLSALVTEVARQFHAAGYELSFALEPIGHDSGDNGYDYQVLATQCDRLHFMDYDYHYPGGDHMGPIAPLGWVDAAFVHAEQTGHPEKFLLGLANYAIASGWYDWTRDAMSLCIASVAETTDEMLTCPYNGWGYIAGLAPHCLTRDHGTIWFENLDSMEEKMKDAASHHAGGVTYWTLGEEIDGYFPLAKKYFQ
jgi:spore germination protein YaaH